MDAIDLLASNATAKSLLHNKKLVVEVFSGEWHNFGVGAAEFWAATLWDKYRDTADADIQMQDHWSPLRKQMEDKGCGSQMQPDRTEFQRDFAGKYPVEMTKYHSKFLEKFHDDCAQKNINAEFRIWDFAMLGTDKRFGETLVVLENALELMSGKDAMPFIALLFETGTDMQLSLDVDMRVDSDADAVALFGFQKGLPPGVPFVYCHCNMDNDEKMLPDRLQVPYVTKNDTLPNCNAGGQFKQLVAEKLVGDHNVKSGDPAVLRYVKMLAKRAATKHPGDEKAQENQMKGFNVSWSAFAELNSIMIPFDVFEELPDRAQNQEGLTWGELGVPCVIADIDREVLRKSRHSTVWDGVVSSAKQIARSADLDATLKSLERQRSVEGALAFYKNDGGLSFGVGSKPDKDEEEEGEEAMSIFAFSVGEEAMSGAKEKRHKALRAGHKALRAEEGEEHVIRKMIEPKTRQPTYSEFLGALSTWRLKHDVFSLEAWPPLHPSQVHPSRKHGGKFKSERLLFQIRLASYAEAVARSQLGDAQKPLRGAATSMPSQSGGDEAQTSLLLLGQTIAQATARVRRNKDIPAKKGLDPCILPQADFCSQYGATTYDLLLSFLYKGRTETLRALAKRYTFLGESTKERFAEGEEEVDDFEERLAAINNHCKDAVIFGTYMGWIGHTAHWLQGFLDCTVKELSNEEGTRRKFFCPCTQGEQLLDTKGLGQKQRSKFLDISKRLVDSGFMRPDGNRLCNVAGIDVFHRLGYEFGTVLAAA